ncbi:hypothetical protein ACFV42_48105, partial [Streptomyces solisilvae]|uniref:hypothetical protein n=1 Tax=Streptomyces malaysiensis TaxID=92644 RepID=UPI0036BCC472
MSATADRSQAARAARARSVAAACTADLLVSLRPFGPSRRVKLTGFAKAADIAAHGIGAAVCAPEIKPCPDCGRRTKKIPGHRPGCIVREGVGGGSAADAPHQYGTPPPPRETPDKNQNQPRAH